MIALHRLGVLLDVLLHLAFLLFFSGLTAGLIVISLEVLSGRAPDFGTLFRSLHRGPQFLLAFLLYTFGAALGLMLLVVPGIYFAVRYALFAPVLATTHSSALQSLRKAAALSQGCWWLIFLFLLRLFLLNLLGAAFLGLGLLITVPVSVLATASLYRSFVEAGL